MKQSTLNSKLKLIRVGNDAKTSKGNGSRYLTAVMYLAPAEQAGGATVCPMAKLAGCETACLYTAGRGRMSSVQRARIRKTQWFLNDREGFLRQLVADIKLFAEYCRDNGKLPAVRLNGTSDIMWEREMLDGRSVIDRFPMVQFYDYTKISKRSVPTNYSLVWSFSGASDRYAAHQREAVSRGMNIAVVFRDKETVNNILGDDWLLAGSDGETRQYTVINGDKDDLRFLDKPQSIVALYAKGSAKTDRSGFVLDV